MKKLNLKVRFKNPVFWTGFVSATVAFVYSLCGLFDVVPPFTQNEVIQGAGTVITALTMLGVLVDPTTRGVSDSAQALTYLTPKADEEDEDDEDN